MSLLNGIIAGLALFLVAFPRSSDAAGELRCQELGANCECSTTMNSQPWTNLGSGWWYPNEPDPATNTPGYCATEVRSGHTANFFTWPVEATPETLMPAGNAVDFVLRLLSNSGVMIVGRDFGGNGRACVRVYFKLDLNYESTFDGACQNDKYMSLGDDYVAGYGGAESAFTSSMGGFVGGDPVPVSACKGKWCRIEMCANNYATPDPNKQIELYYKNITDGTPERGQTQKSTHSTGGIGSAWPVNGYRQNFCAGFREFSHGMIALWPTNEGQRIGPAKEIEGGLGDSNPPSPPTNLLLSWLWGKWSRFPFWRSPAHSAGFNSIASMLPESSCRTSPASRFVQERMMSTR